MNIPGLIDQFAAASVDASLWRQSLGQLADATGCARTQLIGIGGSNTRFFNIVSNSDDVENVRFEEVAGYDPAINFRVAAGLKAAPMAMVTEADYDHAISGLTNDAYLDYCDEADMPYGCQTSLFQSDHGLIGLAMLRTRSDGRSSQDQQAVFATIAPHVRNAVRVQQMLEMESDKLTAGALDTMRAATFTCDARGRVHAYSVSAERLLRDGVLSLVAGRLKARSRRDDDALDGALARAIAHPASGVVSAALINDGDPLLLDVTALPDRCWNLDKRPRLLVVVRGRGETEATAVTRLRAAFDLTEAEAHVALGYARGKSRDLIARDRGVSVHTVRVQTKSLFGKMAVNREVALAALAGQFL